MIKEQLIIILLAMLIASPIYAQINVEATGYDWIEYSSQQKAELVKTLFHILKIDSKVENGVTALDELKTAYS